MGFWSSVREGTLSVTGTIYELADSATLGALPNTIQGVQISTIGANNNLAANAAQALPNIAQPIGQVPNELSAGLPQTGANIGQGVGYLGYYGLTGVGAGAGNAAGSIGEGLGSGLGDLGTGLGKGLLPIVLLVVGIVIVLALATRGRTVQAGQVRVA